ncbi:MAG: DUF4174 domain-containing protein [Pseudomonadota bacterium]
MAAEDPEPLLDELRWKSRVLLIFSPEADDARSTAFRQAVSDAACAMEARDLVLGQVTSGGDSFLASKQISPASSAALRRKFGIAEETFRVLLIGKDGGVKASYSKAPALAEVFALIDGMPMRRQEMREQAEPCVE